MYLLDFAIVSVSCRAEAYDLQIQYKAAPFSKVVRSRGLLTAPPPPRKMDTMEHFLSSIFSFLMDATTIETRS